MKKSVQFVVALVMTLLFANYSLAQDRDRVPVRKTRYVYLWDVTSSLVSNGDTSLKKATFEFLFKDIESHVADNEVIIHPFNDRVLETIVFTPGSNSYDRKSLEAKGEEYINEHRRDYNDNKANKSITQQQMYKKGGYTNVGAATRMAEEYFKDTTCNNIVILITDGCNEYNYDLDAAVRDELPILSGDDGKAQLRLGIEAADSVAAVNTNTVNRFIYVAFGDDHPYRNVDNTMVEMNTSKTMVLSPNEKSLSLEFYEITAKCKNRSNIAGTEYHMNSREDNIEIEFDGVENLPEPVKVSVSCKGGCMGNEKKDVFHVGGKYGCKSIKVTGITIDEHKFSNDNKLAKFNIAIELDKKSAVSPPDSDTYWEVYWGNGDNEGKVVLESCVSKEFLGTIKVRIK